MNSKLGLRLRVGAGLLSMSLLLGNTLAACGSEDDDPTDQDIDDVGATASITITPFPTTGEPLATPDKTWTYVEFPDTKCRDGSPAGIAVSKNSASKKLMIFLEGGGACFDAITCAVNPANTSIFQEEKLDGVFDRSNLENPVADWNFVYVPYCTGDTHGGTRADAVLPDVQGPQQFVGYLNIQKFLQRVVPTFKDSTDVLLTGISAGGFGAAQNAILVQRAFFDLKVKVIDDSGPALSTAVVPECLQRKWREAWGLDNSVLADCGKACPNKDDFTQAYALAMARTFRDRPSGLIESTRDGIISRFFGAGINECTGTALLSQVPPELFESDLLAYREKIRDLPNFGTYLPSSTKHTWLADPMFFTAEAGGVRLVDWFAKIVRGESAGHAGP